MFAISLLANVDTFSWSGVLLLIANALILASLAAGVVSVIFIIVGAIQYITSGGGDGIATAKRTITFAVAGLALSVAAFAVVQFVIVNLTR